MAVFFRYHVKITLKYSTVQKCTLDKSRFTRYQNKTTMWFALTNLGANLFTSVLQLKGKGKQDSRFTRLNKKYILTSIKTFIKTRKLPELLQDFFLTHQYKGWLGHFRDLLLYIQLKEYSKSIFLSCSEISITFYNLLKPPPPMPRG